MKKGTSKYYPFETARELIRGECISSKIMYSKWHDHNHPAKIPARPDIVYKKFGWIGWNDFLGNNNPAIHVKKNCLPFIEARRFVRSLGLVTFDDWRKYVKSGNKPENIPSRPDYFYRNDWFTWKDFLRGDIREIAKQAVSVIPILYIIKVMGTPSNVMKIDVTSGGKESLMKAHNKGAKIIAAFEYTRQLDWRSLLSKYANNYYYGETDDYSFSMNPSAFIFELSTFLQSVKF